jgi:translation elongation factor EF-G
VSPTTGKNLERSFCQFVLSPLRRLVDLCLESDGTSRSSALEKAFAALQIPVPTDDHLFGKRLMKWALAKFMPLGPVLLEVIVGHLPSPSEAHEHRAALHSDSPTLACHKDGMCG